MSPDEDLTPSTWYLAYNTFLNWSSQGRKGGQHMMMPWSTMLSFKHSVRFFTNGPFIVDPSDYRWGNALVNKNIARSSSTTQDPSHRSYRSFRYSPYDSPFVPLLKHNSQVAKMDTACK